MKTYPLTNIQAAEILFSNEFVVLESDRLVGSYCGGNGSVYFSCGEENCCEDSWFSKEEFIKWSNGSFFRIKY